MIRKFLMASAILAGLLSAAFEETLIDFNELGSYENHEDEQFKMLFNANWRAALNSSADFLVNRKATYCANAPVKGTITEKNEFKGGTGDGYVLGIRVNFPQSDYNAFAKVTPMFEIESYAGEDGNKFLNKGLLKNTGTLKTIRVYVKGKNFPHAMYINIKDESEKVTAYFLGYLNFEGWGTRSWENPNYLENVRDRRIVRVPLYPRVEPLSKLDSFTFFRDSAALPGDFIAYIGWTKIEYDKSIIETEEDIDDEKIWKIRTDASDLKAKSEKERLERVFELENLEKAKMNKLQGEAKPAEAKPAEGAAPAAAPAGN